MVYKILSLNLIRVCENSDDTQIDMYEHIYYNAEDTEYEGYSICELNHEKNCNDNNGYICMKPVPSASDERKLMNNASHHSESKQDVYYPNTENYETFSTDHLSNVPYSLEKLMNPPVEELAKVKTVKPQNIAILKVSRDTQGHFNLPPIQQNVLDSAKRNHFASVHQHLLYKKMKRLIIIGFVMLFVFGALSIFLSVILSLRNNNMMDSSQTSTFIPRDINFTTEVESMEPVNSPLVPIAPEFTTKISPISSTKTFVFTKHLPCFQKEKNLTILEEDPLVDPRNMEITYKMIEDLFIHINKNHQRIFIEHDDSVQSYLINQFNEYENFNTELIKYINTLDAETRARVCGDIEKILKIYPKISIERIHSIDK